MTAGQGKTRARRSCYFWLMVFLLAALAVGTALWILGLVYATPHIPFAVTL
jgi:hypothetical protein